MNPNETDTSGRSFCAIAIDVGGTKIAGALCCYRAATAPPAVVARCERPCAPERGGAAVLATIEDMAHELGNRARADAALGQLVGAGVATAGVVDPNTGAISFANEIMPGWSGQPVAERMTASLGVPTQVMGDVHAHALGEARWGAGRGAESFLMVAVGTGLGGAYVQNGVVARGAHGAAGHLGHSLHPAATGLACVCGARAHVETVTSGTALRARYADASFADSLTEGPDGAQIAQRAAQGEPRAIEALAFCGRALGEAIGSWCNVLDPALVLLSGSMAQAGPTWRAALDAGFASQALAPLQDIPIRAGALGGNAPLIGAAEHLLDWLNLKP